jgi:catecholate siderophore receptor
MARHSIRFGAVSALVTSAAVSGPLATPAQAALHQQAATPTDVRQFAIAGGPLDVALAAFTAQTGLQIVAEADVVRAIVAPGVSGRHTIARALELLLAGTGLRFRFTTPTVVVIDLAIKDQRVDVRGGLPASSSPKFSQPLVDTPQTITVVPRAVIDQQGATSLRDVLRNVPGITIQAGEGGGGLPGDTLTLRGFSASGDIFVDGIRDVGAYSRDAFNLEQVEIIKGPASTFGGRGSTGGAINLATKTPGVISLRSADVGLGSAGYRRTTVDVNESVPGVRGMALRFNAMWQDAGVAGRDVVENQAWAVAPSLAMGLGSPTRLTVGYQHLEQNNVPDYGLPWGTHTDPVTGQVFPTGAFNAAPAVDQSNFYGLRDYDFERIDNDVATARLERDLGRVTLRNITRYGDTVRDHAITAPRPPNRQLQRRWMRNETTANQSSVSTGFTTHGLRHDVAGGVEFAIENVATRNSAQATNQPQVRLQDPDPNQQPLGPMPGITGNPSEASTRTAGAYLFDTVHAGDSWQFSGGVRWDRSHVAFEQQNLTTGAVTSLERTDRMTSWRGGITYKPRPEGTIYAGYGTSFNPSADAGATGTALSPGDTAATSVNLAPEKSRNVEVGAKWSLFGDRLAASGAVFRTEKTNARTRNLTNDPFVLAGVQRVQGVEVGVSGQLNDRWSALLAVSVLDSDIVRSENPAEQGLDLALTPKTTASLWTTYNATDRLSLGVGAQYMDAVFRNSLNSLAVPSYWLANAMASYELNSHLTLRVNASNLGDVSYVDRVGGGHYIPGPRRSMQITAGLKF